jgi:hypothetical protein
MHSNPRAIRIALVADDRARRHDEFKQWRRRSGTAVLARVADFHPKEIRDL